MALIHTFGVTLYTNFLLQIKEKYSNIQITLTLIYPQITSNMNWDRDNQRLSLRRAGQQRHRWTPMSFLTTKSHFSLAQITMKFKGKVEDSDLSI